MKKILLLIVVFCVALSANSYARKLFFEPAPAPAGAPAPKPAPAVTEVVKTIQLRYADPTDMAAAISGILQGSERCSANKDLNILVLRGSPEAVDKLAAFIAALDVPVYNVVFDAKIAVMEVSSSEYDNYPAQAAKKLGISTPDTSLPMIVAGSADDIIARLGSGAFTSKKVPAAGRKLTSIKISDDENTLVSFIPSVNMDGTVAISATSLPGSPDMKGANLTSGQSLIITSVFPTKTVKVASSGGLFNMFGSAPMEKELLRAYVLILTPNLVGSSR